MAQFLCPCRQGRSGYCRRADIAGATVTERPAGAPGREGDLVSGVTGLSEAEIEAKASAKVLQADSDMIGTLVDITV